MNDALAQETSKRKKRPLLWRVLKYVVGVFLLIIFVLGLAVVLIRSRARQQWPSAMPPPIELPEPAFPAPDESEQRLLRAAAAIKGFDGEFEIGSALAVKGLPPADTLELWRPSEEALALLDPVLDGPGLQLELRDANDAPVPIIQVLKLARCLTLKAWSRASEEAVDEAATEMTRVLRFGGYLEYSGGNFTTVAIGGVIIGLAIVEFRELMNHAVLRRDSIEAFAAEVDRFIELPRGIVAGVAGNCIYQENACESFRGVTASAIFELDPHDQPESRDPGETDVVVVHNRTWPYDPDRTIALLRTRCHRELEIANAAPYQRPEPPEWEDLFPFEGRSATQYLDNPVGRLVLKGLSISHWELVQELDIKDAQMALIRAELALVLYRRDHQNDLPDSLEELVPEYLSAPPEDPYSGEALRYDFRQRVLWSVGSEDEAWSVPDEERRSSLRFELGDRAEIEPADAVEPGEEAYPTPTSQDREPSISR